MDAAKVRLSKEEMTLVSDPDWILTKNSIMERAVALMAQLSEKYGLELSDLRHKVELEGYEPPPNWDTPKISKGESYKGLPYVVLDYPRLFTKEHVLAIRTMFWWGHYFSVTLHLKGWMLDMFGNDIEQGLQTLAKAGFHIAVSGHEWKHELEEGNYAVIKKDSYVRDKDYPFVKFSAKCSLDKWNEAPEILFELFRVLVRVLGLEGSS